ncbi:MAG: FRG domain-containing protein [Phycisphaeraceae bacterium]|nr:FRG domain-containing protein [Phycisphaeraceae bacterium]
MAKDQMEPVSTPAQPPRSHFVSTWEKFKQALSGFLAEDIWGRRTRLFRGQPNASWHLTPTLDRLKAFPDEHARDGFLQQLVNEFALESQGAVDSPPRIGNIEAWEMIGRHHGLPTRLLDWTTSPYIAAFFAFCELNELPLDQRGENVSVWVLKRQHFRPETDSSIEITEPGERLTLRARVQRSVFTRLLSNDKHLDKAIPHALLRLDIPVSEVKRALQDLDEMNINHASMFPGPDGAARTVRERLIERKGQS